MKINFSMNYSILIGLIIFLNVVLVYDYLETKSRTDGNQHNILALAKAYTDIANKHSEIALIRDSEIPEIQLPTRTVIIEKLQEKETEPIQMVEPRQIIPVYFASDFTDEMIDNIISWADSYYFCHRFIRSLDYNFSKLVISTHSVADENTAVGNLTRDETYGFADVNAYGKGRRGFVYLNEGIATKEYQRGVLIHELSHFFGLDIHNCSAKLQFSQWCIAILENYLQNACKE